jgi:hypothetical protein
LGKTQFGNRKIQLQVEQIHVDSVSAAFSLLKYESQRADWHSVIVHNRLFNIGTTDGANVFVISKVNACGLSHTDVKLSQVASGLELDNGTVVGVFWSSSRILAVSLSSFV